jgi:chromosome segregation ATPase
MQPREIVQFNAMMNEGAVDRALVIKGEFSKEIKELNAAIAEWDKRGKVDARLKEFAAQTKAFAGEVEAFNQTVEKHKEDVAKLTTRASAVSKRESALAAKEAEAIKGESALAVAKDKHDEQVKADTEAMGRARADIAAQQADLSARLAEIVSRETSVAEKIVKLRAITG